MVKPFFNDGRHCASSVDVSCDISMYDEESSSRIELSDDSELREEVRLLFQIFKIIYSFENIV